jgi:uroporphyrin-III C-methyltransferase/precorrin-2 dehydrogenase/sirohydrochlorin ferrochelatase/uroporphyrin-III C-methyltransferase
MQHKGFVSLVGAGPGDPDLLTVKALRLIQLADTIVYDRLVSSEILELIPSGVSRISVAKSSGHHCVPQQQINELIVNLAKSGRHIVRLKGGDPYLFGRGGEEALALKQHDIEFEVVPGITAASGCSAYSGIPLTHRGMSRSVRFLTGHFSNDEPLNIDWQHTADSDCTLVIYMGLANLSQICTSLIDKGMPASSHAAAIENGTSSQQKRILSRLGKLSDDVRQSHLQAPVMIIIGEVVSLADELDWFQLSLEVSENDQNAAAVC